MPEVFLAILKYLFLALIFLFLARAVKAMYLEITGPRAARSGVGVARPAPAHPPDRLAVVSSQGKTRTYSLDEELMIGRGEKCQVVLDDAYASQVHARVFRRGEAYFIEDMGSTNGTYLNRRKVTSAMPVSRGDRVRIGKTELEFRR